MLAGYVAFIDVLGFSAMVAADSQGERVDGYLAALTEAMSAAAAGQSVVEYVVFSDSIVLTTQGDSQDSLKAMLRASSSLFGRMLERDIPLRGAISYGAYNRTKTDSGVFVAGNAIVEAYQFENQQNWVGIMVAPSVQRRVPKLHEMCNAEWGGHYVERGGRCAELLTRIDWAAFLRPYKIPFKAGHASEKPLYEGLAVVPTHGQAEPDALKQSLCTSEERLEWLRSIAPNPAAQEKYVAPINLVRDAGAVWSAVSHTLAKK